MMVAKMETERMLKTTRELKMYQDAFVAVLPPTPPVLFKVTQIVQSDAVNNRVGQRIDITKVEYLIAVFIDAATIATPQAQGARFVLFQWHLDDNTSPPPVQGPLDVNALTDYVQGQPDYESRHNYTILMDKFLTVDTVGNGFLDICEGRLDGPFRPVQYTLPNPVVYEGINNLYLYVGGLPATIYSVSINVFYTDA